MPLGSYAEVVHCAQDSCSLAGIIVRLGTYVPVLEVVLEFTVTRVVWSAQRVAGLHFGGDLEIRSVDVILIRVPVRAAILVGYLEDPFINEPRVVHQAPSLLIEGVP